MIEVRQLKHKFWGILIALTLSAGLIGSFVGPGIANAASNSIAFTPRKDYTIKPGGSISDTLFVTDLSQTSALNISLRVLDFTGQGETGSPSLLLKSTSPTPWSLKPFLTIPSTYTVAAGKSAYIPISIHIPANQGAGSYYSAIEYSANTGFGAPQVSLSASGATLVFVTVPGQTSELLQLKQFGAFVVDPTASNGVGTFQSWFFTTPPQEVAYSVEDEGNVAEQPAGSILIKNMFGKDTVNIPQANPTDDLVLIGQTRLFDTCIITGQKQAKSSTNQTVTEPVCEKPSLSPGRYTIQLEAFYGQNGSNVHEINAVATFWYLPLWFIIIFFVIVFVIILVILKIISKLRRGHKHQPPSVPPTPVQ